MPMLHNMEKAVRYDRHLAAIILLSLAYFSCWIYYCYISYATFNAYYYDLGIYSNDIYWHLHYAPNVLSLQYLVFYNHLSPFSLLLLPLFALYQSPMTLVAIQDMFLAATAVVVYLVATSITKSRTFGLAMAIVFLANPGTVGLALGYIHIEAFMPLLYMLTFYSFIKGRVGLFITSYVLLLALVETSPIVGLFLLFGLLYYETRYASKKDFGEHRLHKTRTRLIIAGIALSIAALLLYGLASSVIISSYAGTSSLAAPPILRLTNYLQGQAYALSNPGAVQYVPAALSYGVIGLFVVFLGFGLSGLVDPVFALVMCLPWIAEVFLIRNALFAYPPLQYYGYAILGGSLVAAILGYRIVAVRGNMLLDILKADRRIAQNVVSMSALSLGIFLSIMVFILSQYSLSLQPSQQYAGINGALASLIPSNSTVLAQGHIAPHLFYVKYLELSAQDSPAYFESINRTLYWAIPDYVVADSRLPGYSYLVNSTPSGPAFNVPAISIKNYTQIYNSSGLHIWKRD